MSNPKFGYRRIKQAICAAFREEYGFAPRQKEIVIIRIRETDEVVFHVAGVDYKYLPELEFVKKLNVLDTMKEGLR